MSNQDFDARARQASANLKAAVEAAELTSVSPAAAPKRRPFAFALRPALVIALLTIGSAVGVAVVMDSPPPVPAPPASTTTTEAPATTEPAAAATEETTPTTAYVVPSVSQSTTTTEAADVEPPLLEITSPEDGEELEEKTVEFKGITEPGATVYAGPYEAEVDSEGNWHIVLVLQKGANGARFTARDAAGNESQASITVHYIVETESTTTTIEKELAKFKAYATFGTCSETPPFDIYYGNGEPGSIVSITSEYGSGSVEVSEEGTWEKKVIFETAPENETFIVTVSDNYGRSKQFEMIHTP